MGITRMSSIDTSNHIIDQKHNRPLITPTTIMTSSG